MPKQPFYFKPYLVGFAGGFAILVVGVSIVDLFKHGINIEAIIGGILGSALWYWMTNVDG
jgi:hypothetical protein